MQQGCSKKFNSSEASSKYKDYIYIYISNETAIITIKSPSKSTFWHSNNNIFPSSINLYAKHHRCLSINMRVRARRATRGWKIETFNKEYIVAANLTVPLDLARVHVQCQDWIWMILKLYTFISRTSGYCLIILFFLAFCHVWEPSISCQWQCKCDFCEYQLMGCFPRLLLQRMLLSCLCYQAACKFAARLHQIWHVISRGDRTKCNA